MENVLLNDIYTFIFHKSSEFFDNVKSFTDCWNDIPKLQFWTVRIGENILCHYLSCKIQSFNLAQYHG